MRIFEDIVLYAGEELPSGGLHYEGGHTGPMDCNDEDTIYLQRLAKAAELKRERADVPLVPDAEAVSTTVPELADRLRDIVRLELVHPEVNTPSSTEPLLEFILRTSSPQTEEGRQ